MPHVIELRDGEVRVGDHGIGRHVACNIADIRQPSGVVVCRIDGRADHLDIAGCKFILQPSQRAEFGRAERCKSLECKNSPPAVAEPVVKTELPLRCLCGEVRRHIIDPKHHGTAAVIVKRLEREPA